MDQYSEKIWVLITRKLSGESTPEENIRFQQWLNEDPENCEFYNRLKSSWDQNPGESVDSFSLSLRFNSKNGLKKLRTKLNQEYDSVKQKSDVVFKNKIKNKKSSGLHIWKLAASILVIVLTSIVYLVNSQDWYQPVTTTYTTTDMEQRIITLSDGSVVRLNRNSTLQVTDYRSDEPRMIWLEGEAFFDVTHNPDRSFIVHAGDAVVEVLGTSFNLKKGKRVMVAVQEGLVSFRHQNHEERSTAILTAGNVGLLSEFGDDIIVENTSIENYISWKNGYLRFSNTPLENVMLQLSRIYDFKYDFQDTSFGSKVLTFYTERLNIDEILNTISEVLEIEYQKKGGVIVWSENKN